jgi:imidazolonepropionase-like amidohydrolase
MWDMSDYDIEEELVQMENAGMSFDQILASLTSNPAKKFNRAGETGTVERGKNADLVILNGNPASDIRNFTKVVMTIHNGKVVFEKH